MKSFGRTCVARAQFLSKLAVAISTLVVSGCAAHYYQQSSVPVEEPPVEVVEVVEVNYFYDDLAPYGRWVNSPHYGWVWTPYDAPLGWRPYSDGQWAYTDYGWSWVSYEPFGWATYHYGRWAFDPHYGWLWVPDTVWAPAWVAWQSGGGWVGWAPLPPSAHWQPSRGIYHASTQPIPSNHWCFVEGRHLSQTKLKSSIVSVAKNQSLLKGTKDKTRYVNRAGTPVNEGIDVGRWEKETGRKAPRLKVVDTKAPPRGRGAQATAVEYYRPKVRGDKRTEPSREIREPAVAIPDSELRKQSEIERRQMEDALAKERAELERQHQKELADAKTSKKKGPAQEIKKRQAAENQALEQHAAQQREVLKERQQKKIVKVNRSRAPEQKEQPQETEESQSKDPSNSSTPKGKPTKSKGK